jgi:hypothetical protein
MINEGFKTTAIKEDIKAINVRWIGLKPSCWQSRSARSKTCRNG